MGKAWVEGRGRSWGRVQGRGSRARKGHLETASHHYLGFKVSVQRHRGVCEMHEGVGGGQGGESPARGSSLGSSRTFSHVGLRAGHGGGMGVAAFKEPHASSQSCKSHTGSTGTLSLVPNRNLVYGLNLGLCHTQTRDTDCLWSEHEQVPWEPRMKPPVCLCGPG